MPDPEYELLTVETVVDYVADRDALGSRLARVDSVREVGDGNLNLVFVVSGEAPDGDAAGLVVKQALPYVRADPSWPMSPTRNHAEARALHIHGRAESGRGPSALRRRCAAVCLHGRGPVRPSGLAQCAQRRRAPHRRGGSARALRRRRRLRHLGVRRRCRGAQGASPQTRSTPRCARSRNCSSSASRTRPQDVAPCRRRAAPTSSPMRTIPTSPPPSAPPSGTS